MQVTGMGSGLDVNSIIEQLIEADSVKLKNLETKEKTLEIQLSAYGSIKNKVDNLNAAISTLSNSSNYTSRKLELSSNASIKATLNGKPEVCSYNISIENLASAHKLSSKGFASIDTQLSTTGSLKISSGNNNFTINIKSDDTLQDVKKAINDHDDNHGVTASILEVNNMGQQEFRLIISTNQTGVDNTIYFENEIGDLLTNFDLTHEISAAQNAKINFDGFTIYSQNNSFNNVISGVNFTATSCDNTKTTLSISDESTDISSMVTDFVKSYNDLLSTLGTLGSYSDGALHGDTTLARIKALLRRDIAPLLTSSGIITQEKSGSLSVSHDNLNTKIATSNEAVIELFTNSSIGIAIQMQNVISNLTTKDGVLSSRTKSIDNAIHSVEQRVEKEKNHLDVLQESYRKQFSSLDSLLSNLNATSDYLTNQLSNFQYNNRGRK